MLDEQIVALAKRTTAAQLRDMDEPLASSVGAWKAKLRGNGALFLYVLRTYQEDVRARAQVIWRNLQRAHASRGSPLSETMRHDLLNEFRAELDEVIGSLTRRLDNDMIGCPAGFPYRLEFGNGRDHEIARHEAEIEHYVTSLETAAARGANTAGAYNFYGNVGAVVTGRGAVANVVQNIGAEQRESLVAALKLAREALARAAEVPSRDKTELVEIVDEALHETNRERPNTRRLSTALQNIAAAVQGIASGGPAYEAIRAAANAIGIPI